MQTIQISHTKKNGDLLQATFLSEPGMKLISFKKNDLEVMDQTQEEAFSPYGSLIGPHFQSRNPKTFDLPDPFLFPHSQILKTTELKDPLFNGIARYASWNAQSTQNEVNANLSGQDQIGQTPLSQLQGQNFQMTFRGTMTEQGLEIYMSIVSDSDSLVGFNYRYALTQSQNFITADVQDLYEEEGELKPIPSSWNYEKKRLTFDLNQAANYHFRPFIDPLSGSILLQTPNYHLKTTYHSANDENNWQLVRSPGSPFVCIAPMSAKRSHMPNLSVSSMKVMLEIL